MGRPRTTRLVLIGIIPLFLFLSLSARITAGENPGALKLVVSLEQPVIAEPSPARVALHLLNGGQVPVWIYRRAQPPRSGFPLPTEEGVATPSTGGATVTVQLEPAGSAASQKIRTPGHGRILRFVGMPKPRLMSIAPGDDYEEKDTLQLAPARGEDDQPIWGRYRLVVTYRASYSNGEEIQRILDVKLWQGELTSAPLDIELRPASAHARGSVKGSVIAPDGRTIPNALVSLSDEQGHLMNQTSTDMDGRFSFTQLLPGIYWLTVRRRHVTEDTTVFLHVELTAAQPAATPQIVMLPPETYDPQKVLHKPVLFRVDDSAGQPLSDVELEVIWSNGPVLDNVKGRTGADGIAVLNLIPGRNFVTLKRHGCPKQDERADVAPGQEGIDGFKMVLDCAKK
jgi:hypothetical protein